MQLRKRVNPGDPLNIPANDWNALLDSLERGQTGDTVNCMITKPAWTTDNPIFDGAPYQENFHFGTAVNLFDVRLSDNGWYAGGWHTSIEAFVERGTDNYEYDSVWQGYCCRWVHSIGVIASGQFPFFNITMSGTAWFLMVGQPGTYSFGGYLFPRPDGLWQRCTFGPVELLGVDYERPVQVITNSLSDTPVYRTGYFALGTFARSVIHHGVLEPAPGGGYHIVDSPDGSAGGDSSLRIPAIPPPGYSNFLKKLSYATLPAGCRFVFSRTSYFGFLPKNYDPNPHTVASLVDIDC